MSNREQILRFAQTEDDRFLLSRVIDLAFLADKNHQLKTTQFLNEHELCVATKAAPRLGVSFLAFGGYEQAQRKVLAFSPEYLQPTNEDMPISLLRISGRDLSALTHRDYLGCLLSLGIVREKLGDILPGAQQTDVLCMSDIAPFIGGQIEQIGNVGVTVSVMPHLDVVVPEMKFEQRKATVSSLRLDCIVSAATGLSRTAAADLVRQGKVMLQWEPTTEPSKPVKQGDMLSIRKVGRIQLEQVGGTTKKGRIAVTIKRYV